MRDTVDRLRRLLEEGYSIDHIESDHGAVVTTLRRGPLMVTLRLLPSEASRLFALRAPLRP